MEKVFKRGDVFYADLSPVIGSEQDGSRPVVIIQNDIGNRHSPTVIIAAITSRISTKANISWYFCLRQIRKTVIMLRLIERVQAIGYEYRIINKKRGGNHGEKN